MLPHPSLKPLYDKLVWVYVYRDFSGSKEDLAAERIMLRFGISGYPFHFLADPHDWRILKDTGRKVETFLAAGNEVTVEATESREALERTKAGEKLAIRLEQRPSLKVARKAIDDPDIVAKTRALAILVDKDPKKVAKRAVELLAIPVDPIRYRVCDVLEKRPDPDAAPALVALVEKPEPSMNPNVLRCAAVRALGSCGNADSVGVIAPFAKSGKYLNSLTGISVDALAAIAKRHKEVREEVTAILKASYPIMPKREGMDLKIWQRNAGNCLLLAMRIHKALGEKGKFPKIYNDETRAELMR